MDETIKKSVLEGLTSIACRVEAGVILADMAASACPNKEPLANLAKQLLDQLQSDVYEVIGRIEFLDEPSLDSVVRVVGTS